MNKALYTIPVVALLAVIATYQLQQEENHPPSNLPVKENPSNDAATGLRQELASEEPDIKKHPQTQEENGKQNKPRYQSKYGPLPESLKSTRPPQGLRVDDGGNLIIDGLMVRVFDYFLTIVGEEPLETVVNRITEYIEQSLTGSAQQQAKEIFSNYLAMKSELIGFEKQWNEQLKAEGRKASLKELLLSTREIRLKHLGEEVYEGFYQDQDKMDDYALKKLEIAGNDSLTEQEKHAAIQEAEQLLPENARKRREYQRDFEQLQQTVEQAKAQGATEEAIFEMRARLLGTEKAERFRQADQKVNAWNERVDDYRAQRAKILDSGLSSSDQSTQLSALRESLFNERERRRIEVIDRMKDSEKAP